MTTHTIVARKNHPKADEFYNDCYCYDDQYVKAEPLIHQTTATIDKLFTLQGLDAPKAVNIDFCLDAKAAGWLYDGNPDVVVTYLTEALRELDGTTYIVNPFFPEELERQWLESELIGEPPLEAWLCQHLCDYFPVVPQSFFCKITKLS